MEGNVITDPVLIILVESFFLFIFLVISLALAIGIKKKNDFVMNGPPNSKGFWPYGLLRQMGEKAIYYYHLIISIGFFITSLFILVSIINQFIVILQNNV